MAFAIIRLANLACLTQGPVGTDRAATPFARAVRVPLAGTQLNGREAERARVLELLADHDTPMLALTGAGGSGKMGLTQERTGEMWEAPSVT
jgi:hypothetical protein